MGDPRDEQPTPPGGIDGEVLESARRPREDTRTTAQMSAVGEAKLRRAATRSDRPNAPLVVDPPIEPSTPPRAASGEKRFPRPTEPPQTRQRQVLPAVRPPPDDPET